MGYSPIVLLLTRRNIMNYALETAARILSMVPTKKVEKTPYEEHELEDLGEPVNYKAALLDPEFDKWRNAMNVEIQSMKDNGVWDLVDLPPNGKIISNKLLFKKKTDMDGAVHIYKARLVAKGFTQTYKMSKLPSSMDISQKRYFAMKDLGEAAYLLGIKINRDRSQRLIAVCQSAYIEKILKRFHMENSKCGTVGSIMYAVRCTRPDIANTKDMFLVYGGDIKRELKVSCYIDVGYLTDADDLKSQTGYVFALNGGAEDVWIRKFIYGLGVVPTIKEPIKMYCGNIQTIVIANESGITKGARHFRAKVDYLREVIDYSDIKLEKVQTYDNDNLADPFTKASAFPKHSEHTKNIGMLPASSLM
nr:hypothetical protein [Tanacetum cinerariifolium]